MVSFLWYQKSLLIRWIITLRVYTLAIKKICDIYDWDGKGVLDMYFFGDILYALVNSN